MRTTGTDVNELPQDLRQSVKYLHLMSDALPALVAYIDRDHRYRFVNKTFEEWFGRPADELIGMRLSELVGPHAYEIIRRYSNLALSGEQCSYETWMPYSNGRRYVSASYIPDRQPGGEIPGFFVLVHDLTGRKEAEMAVHQEREFTQAILDSVESEICILDQNGQILAANEPWHQFWVRSGGDDGIVWTEINYFEACGPEEGTHSDDPTVSEVVSGIKDVLAGKSDKFSAEYPCHSEDEQRWFRVTVTPLAGMNNHPLARAVVDHSLITEQKLATEAVRAANEQLASSIQDLADSQEALQRELEYKDRFFSILAHDLRSPFTTILGGSASLAKKAEVLGRDAIAVYARNINSSMNRVHALLNQLLEWGQIQTGALPLQRTKIDLGDTVSVCLGLVQAQATAKDVRMHAELEAQWVHADINALRTVLRNLLTNAIKFSEQGDDVTVRSMIDENEVIVSIVDTGVGISADVAEDIFHLDRKTTTPGTGGETGTGLGLPLCKDLVERLGGRIWVEPARARGTAVHFALPKAGEGE